jgi:hypothetical protein
MFAILATALQFAAVGPQVAGQVAGQYIGGMTEHGSGAGVEQGKSGRRRDAQLAGNGYSSPTCTVRLEIV